MIGFHTFTMYIMLTSEEANEILGYFRKYCENSANLKIVPYTWDDKIMANESKYARVWKTKCLPNKYLGLKWTFLFDLPIPNLYPRNCVIKVKITPNVLIGYDDFITICNESDIPAIETAYNTFIKEIVPVRRLWKHLWFGAYRISRLDICGNFDLWEMGYSCTVKQKRKLLKQALVPYPFNERIVYDKISKRWGPYKNSFLAESDSVTISFYGKQRQLMEKFPYRLDDIKRAENLMRCEIQFGPKKMAPLREAMSRELSWNERGDYAVTKRLLSDKFTKSKLESYFKRIFMMGDFYTYDDAVNNVVSLGFRQQRCDRLLWVLDLVKEHKGINNAKIFLENNQGDVDLFIESAKELIEHGINPCTTPRRVGYVENLLTKYDDMIRPLPVLRLGEQPVNS